MLRVTQILRLAGVTEDPCAQGLRGKLDPQAFARYLLRGTHVHLACAMDDEGRLVEAELDPGLLPYLWAWRQFRREFAAAMMLIEAEGVNKEQEYVGHFDRLAKSRRLNGGRPVVLDIKTSAAPPWVWLQLAGYAVTDTLRKIKGLGRAVVALRKDGSYRLEVRSPLDAVRDDAAWRGCVAVAGWRMRYMGAEAPAKEEE